MRKRSIKNLLKNKIPENLIEKVNRSFEIVGDIAITEINPELERYESEIGNSIIKINPSIKTVLKKSGIHKGEFRTQDLKYVAGEKKKETIYTENGIKLKINPESVYFSARLSVERQELMKKLKPNKRVLVMFSGIGPYTFVALKNQPNLLRITSIELNPEGHKYALENLNLNKNLLKKSNIYRELLKFLRENNLPINEKQLMNNLNELKINQINADVKEQVKLFNLKKFEGEINKKKILQFSKRNNKKDFFNYLKNLEEKNIFLNLDNFSNDEKKEISFYLIVFENKFNFICKIENKYYIFNNQERKGYLLNFLEGKKISNIEKFDEIYMPLPKAAEIFLDDAFKVSDKNCIIHLYGFLHENEFPKKIEGIVKKISKKNNKKIKIIETRKVGQYAPGKYRVCCDFILF